MYLIFFIICLLFAIIFIFKNDKENYLTGLSFLVMMVTILLSILLVNLAVFAGLDNSTTFMAFDFDVSSIFNIVKVLVTISLISMLVYFYSKQKD